MSEEKKESQRYDNTLLGYMRDLITRNYRGKTREEFIKEFQDFIAELKKAKSD